MEFVENLNLRIFLPVYLALYFLALFVYPSMRVWKQTGKNPLVLPRDDTAYGLIGFYFKITFLALLLDLILFAVFPELHQKISFHAWNMGQLKVVGLSILIISFFWIFIAQRQMDQSWRIGIDAGEPTDLVTSGVFGISRNPIFLGILISVIGYFMLIPDIVSLVILIVMYLLIQIQVRLEEAHLKEENGDTYKAYFDRVRRWI